MPRDDRPTSSCTRLTELTRDALVHDPDGGPWEQALVFALEQAVRMQSYQPTPVSPYDQEKQRLMRALLEDYRAACRRYQEDVVLPRPPLTLVRQGGLL